MMVDTLDVQCDAARCEMLLADHLAAAVARFGAGALGVIDLPPLDPSGAIEPAQLRVTAALMWARYVDRSGLLDFVDALARGVTQGTLHLPIAGTGAAPLFGWWRERDEHFSRDERLALYARLFGDPTQPDHPVPGLLTSLCQKLVAIGRARDEGAARYARIQAGTAARALAAELSSRAVGITGFAARDIVAQIRAALEVLGKDEIRHALGGVSPWQAIRMFSPSVLGRAVNPTRAVAQAHGARVLLEWLADQAVKLDTPSPIAVTDAVIAAAYDILAKDDV